MVGLGAHRQKAQLRVDIFKPQLPLLGDLTLGGVQERESAFLGDDIGVLLYPGLEPDF